MFRRASLNENQENSSKAHRHKRTVAAPKYYHFEDNYIRVLLILCLKMAAAAAVFIVGIKEVMHLFPSAALSSTLRKSSSPLVVNNSAVAATSTPNSESAVVFPSECNWECYYDRYPDLARNGLARNQEVTHRHYILHGKQKGRDCTCKQGSTSMNDAAGQSVLSTPIGALGPKNTNRENLIYYDSVYFLSVQFGAKAKSALEVGCATDPFSKYLSWIHTKDCVAPYFATYDSAKGSGTIDDDHAASSSVTQITADFMEWENQKMYDLVVCSQVLEHVPDPSSFTKKLISISSQATIISVPYMWGACTLCGHLTHLINESMVLEWAKPHKPTYHAIIEEKLGKRLVVVFLKDV